MNGLPVTEDEARTAARAVLDFPGADGIEVVVGGSITALTRFASSEIIQNTVRHEVRAHVRAVAGDKSATATTNQLDPEHLRLAAERALSAARASKPDADFPGLPSPDEVGRAEGCFRWDEDTAATSPARRAEVVRDILKATGSASTAGIYETSAHCFGVFSSQGIDCFDAYTRCVMSCLADTGESTGWGEDSSHAVASVDAIAAAKRAIDKAERGREPIDLDPGTFEVVLEPSAVGALLDYLSYAGFGAKQVIEGESFLASKTGAKVAADPVTISDDVNHERSVGIGFDFEGVPRRRVAVIDKGTATGPVSDLRTARKMGAPPTGHYSGSNEFGPYAANVVLEAGDGDPSELIAEVDSGLIVTRFHYVNILDRPETLLTGMTRDGTFLIQRGEVTRPVHNFRFTQSVLEALASVRGIGNDTVAFAPEFSSFGSVATPSLRIGEFRFTSRTSH